MTENQYFQPSTNQIVLPDGITWDKQKTRVAVKLHHGTNGGLSHTPSPIKEPEQDVLGAGLRMRPRLSFVRRN